MSGTGFERDSILDANDERVQRLSGLRRWAVAIACTPLVLLAGCPQQQQTGAAGGISPNATAPAITAPTQPVAAAPAMTQAQTQELAAKARKTQQLINQVEATYRSGVTNYRAGRLEAARSDFDFAVDRMLTSGMDVKSDPQLSDEFDHLLNAINTLEMSALKQGSGFSAPIEAAPLDAANEVTFSANPVLTAKVQEELKTTRSDFPLVVNDYVAGFINYFSNSPAGHAHLLRSLERAGKYKDMISKVLRDEGVPQDLIYLAVAESGFQTQVVNAKSGAGGMWQFMPTQGVYGLSRNGYYDERFDPVKSSIAYAKYMKMLHNQFGDWYLAMAAYNWGAGNVQRAVMRTGYSDFWELYRRNSLPQETKNYVPGIIAAIIMAKNPQQYGLEGMVPDAPVVSDTVSVDYAVDLHLVADVTGASLQEIVGLNPSLLRMRTPNEMGFDLHLPAGTQGVYQKRIKEIPEEKRTSWRFHVVRPGESLDSIASSLHGRAAEIAVANSLNANAVVAAGDGLVIPVANIVVATAHPTHYTTRAGDTLVTVADRFNVSVEDLRRWNNLSSAKITAHRSLAITQPVHTTWSGHTRTKGAHTKADTGDHAAAGERAESNKQSRAKLGSGSNDHARANDHSEDKVRNGSAEPAKTGAHSGTSVKTRDGAHTSSTEHAKTNEHAGSSAKAKSEAGSSKPPAKATLQNSTAKKAVGSKHLNSSK